MVQTIDSLRKKTLLIAPKKPKDIPDVKHALVKGPINLLEKTPIWQNIVSLKIASFFFLCGGSCVRRNTAC